MLPWERRDSILNDVDKYAWYNQPEAIPTLKKTRSFVRMGLATMLSDDDRKAVMGWLLRENRKPIGTNDLSGAEVLALQDWIKPAYSKDTGDFLVSAEFREEIKWIKMEMKHGIKSQRIVDFGLD